VIGENGSRAKKFQLIGKGDDERCGKIGFQESVALSSDTTFGLINKTEYAIVLTSTKDGSPPDQKDDFSSVNRLERVQQRVIKTSTNGASSMTRKFRSFGGIGAGTKVPTTIVPRVWTICTSGINPRRDGSMASASQPGSTSPPCMAPEVLLDLMTSENSARARGSAHGLGHAVGCCCGHRAGARRLCDDVRAPCY